MLEQFNKLRQDFRSLSEEKNEEISVLQKEVATLKSTVNKLVTDADEQNSYTRRETVILSGNIIPVSWRNEDPVRLCQDLIKPKLNIAVDSKQISTAHRLGRYPSNAATDKRPLILKLTHRDLANKLKKTSRTQNGPHEQKLYISECLTQPRRTMLATLRKIKRMHPTVVSGCTSLDGKVYAFTKPTDGTRDKKHLVTTHSQLVDFCNVFVKKPVHTFLEQWQF